MSSPALYSRQPRVPTWLFVSAHLAGTVNFVREDAIKSPMLDHICIVDQSRRHVFKMYGSYDVTEDFTVGFNSTLSSGRPLSAFGQGYPDTDPNVYGSYGDTFYIYQGCAVEGDTCAQEDKLYRYAPRGSAGRTPWTFKVDLSAAYAFSYEGVDMRTFINIFNVLNTQEALALNEHYESSEGTVNQWYGAAYSWQAPRSVRSTFEARY